LRSAIVLKPSTLLHFHRVLTKRKHRMLLAPKRRRRRATMEDMKGFQQLAGYFNVGPDPFPPPPPLRWCPLCSADSPVLRIGPTSPRRSSSAFALRLPDAV